MCSRMYSVMQTIILDNVHKRLRGNCIFHHKQTLFSTLYSATKVKLLTKCPQLWFCDK